MDLHALEYFSAYAEPGPRGHFHKVTALHEDPLLDWTQVSRMVPGICRGWYELARLNVKDRIEFTRDFWLAKLPYQPDVHQFFMKFFDSLDDVGVFLTQKMSEEPFVAHLVYSLADNNGFFHGCSPAKEEDLVDLQKEFTDYILPNDYLSFLQIHNGFAKLTDTGVFPSTKIKERFDLFQKILREGDVPITTMKGVPLNPASLIPFYESFGMPFFQCFWGEWYPEQEMGNVYYSCEERKISTCESKEQCGETLAFQTFMGWLMFYLEKIE